MKILIFLVMFYSGCAPIPVFPCGDLDVNGDYIPVIDTYADEHNCYFTLESCDE